jgi:dipeptidyl aminopeptidase/acylaminoacyl peptidase
MRIRTLSAYLCVAVLSTAADLKTIAPADIANILKVSDPEISPDGKLVAYVVEIPEKSGAQKNAHIWLVATDGKSPHSAGLFGRLEDKSLGC